VTPANSGLSIPHPYLTPPAGRGYYYSAKRLRYVARVVPFIIKKSIITYEKSLILDRPKRRESFRPDGKDSIITKTRAVFKRKREKTQKCRIQPELAKTAEER